MTDRMRQDKATDAVRARFKIECRRCGSDLVAVVTDLDVADDGDGRTDVWGDLLLACETCGAEPAWLYDIAY